MDLVIDGAVNGPLFLAWVEKHLIKEQRPRDVDIMDSLISHKVKGVAATIESAKAQLLYLPPCNPSFTLIELAFLKLKRLIRTDKQGTTDRLRDTCGEVLDQFSES